MSFRSWLVSYFEDFFRLACNSIFLNYGPLAATRQKFEILLKYILPQLAPYHDWPEL